MWSERRDREDDVADEGYAVMYDISMCRTAFSTVWHCEADNSKGRQEGAEGEEDVEGVEDVEARLSM